MKIIKMNTLLSPIARFGLIIAGLLVAGLCRATPVFNVPDVSGIPGGHVQVALIGDAVTDLAFATIKAIYDPLILDYTGGTAEQLTAVPPDYSVVFGNPRDVDDLNLACDLDHANTCAVLVSLSAGSIILSEISGSILSLSFDIKSSAPLGLTPVSFEAFPDPNTGDVDYDVPKTTGFVHVTDQNQAVPEPGPLLLLLAGLLLMRYRLHGQDVKRSGGIKQPALVKKIRDR